MNKGILAFLTALFAVVHPCSAEVRLPHVLGSGMVLQREALVRFWGWANPGETITVKCGWLPERPTVAVADPQGRWQVRVPTSKAGGPHRVVIRGENELELTDVLLGEVWVASGQSNMEMPLVHVSGAYTGVNNAKSELLAAKFPEIRLFQVGNYSSQEPQEDVRPGIEMYGIPPAICEWRRCTPKTVATFSSTAYFFARKLHRELGVPIGMIDASWGGTAAEAWTPRAGLEQLDYQADLRSADESPQRAEAKIPTRLFNGMVNPLRPMRVRGIIWYQGEGNTRRPEKYRSLFETMIGQWRHAWQQELPFYFVQIAPFRYRDVNAALLREAQLACLEIPKTGMVVTTDIGDLSDIHPKNKQEVGRRLALWALAKDYARSVVSSGPLYRDHHVEAEAVRVRFWHGEGLTTRDGQRPKHFEVEDQQGQFHAAMARVDQDEIVLTAPAVVSPRSVRYAFKSDAETNLWNAAGLPASPFRTDHAVPSP